MGGFEIRHNRYRKITGLATAEIDGSTARLLMAIVKVRVDGYMPADVRLRSRIDGKLFTADFSSEMLEQLELDDRVESIAISDDLNVIE